VQNTSPTPAIESTLVSPEAQSLIVAIPEADTMVKQPITVSPMPLDPTVKLQIPLQSTYTSMLDPNEGTELNFTPAQQINGIKCTKLEESDVDEEIVTGRMQFFA